MQLLNCPNCDSENYHHLIETQTMMMVEKHTFSFVQCGDCSLVYLNPRIPKADIGRYYPSYYLPYQGPKAWGKYAWLAEKGINEMDNKRVDLVRRSKNLNPETNILDVGCGKPTFLKTIQKKFKVQSYGIDFTNEGWKDEEGFREINLATGDINIDLPDAPFDVITMWHYLEHDYHPKQTLQQVKQWSTPTTKLIIEVPNYDSLSRKWQKECWGGYHTPRHTMLFTPKTITNMLTQNGWQVDSIKSYGSMDPWVVYWLGEQERQQINWSQPLERKFIPFLFGKILTFPIQLLERWISLGVMTVIARPKS
ncbi:MAG TPA: class I SAM-dependent methyltransferase [Cyclobacteriaceae bacterium]